MSTLAGVPEAPPRRELVTVVLSFRNEEENIPEHIQRLRAALDAAAVDHELVFVNDCSTDRSLEMLRAESARDPRIRVLTTSRPWGVYECMFEGLDRARGDAAIYLDSDLQDPPELIPEMIAEWRKGADVVLTVRRSRAGEAALKIHLTRLAYRIIRGAVYEIDLPVNAGDFRLMSRRVFRRLVTLPERRPYFRGLVSWIGFKQASVYYDRAPRVAGEAKFPLFRHFFRDLATLRGPVGALVAAVTGFSLLPLLLLLPIGLLTLLCASGALVTGAVLHVSGHALATAWLTVGFLSLLAGFQLLGLGVAGLYIARIYDEVRHRPRVVIDELRSFNIEA